MTPTHLTPAGKEALRKTIRSLRESLIAQLKEEAERVYRLGVPLDKAKLSEERAKRRERLEAWADEQSRADWPNAAKGKGAKKGEVKKPNEKLLRELRERYLLSAVKEAAHTFVNRLIILRILEAGELSKPAVLTGGYKSRGYSEFKEYADALCSDPDDDTKGYAALLQLLFDELAVELPGVFGQVGLTSLFPIPAATLREVVEALNNPMLDSAWADETTLGWVYQFWNDPEREALDEKINGGGKIEPHEIAPKTQMFTERYMVEWLLQNSLGQTWLAMCKKHGWTPDFEQVRAGLEERRAGWRAQRAAGEVAPDELMPIHPAGEDGQLEHQWKYWVPQPLPDDAPAAAPDRLIDLKLLDPACGSGHFLVIAFDLLGALYREEARARGTQVDAGVIAAAILEHNLHGVDIDPRAIQIAAAALYLKAKLWVKAQGAATELRITRLNLIAPTFKLAALPADDPALGELKKRLKAEVGIPESLTDGLVGALSGVDHLGTLLRVDKNVREALQAYDKEFFGLRKGSQTLMFEDVAPKQKIQLDLAQAQASVMEQLGRFLDAHKGESDLGLRLEGEQLAAGVRFLQIVQEGRFDVVVGNPPYQGTSKMAEADWFKKHYPRSKADLYACFLERALELTKPGGVSALLTMRGWMFLSSYRELREGLLKEFHLVLLGDIDRGGFQDVPDEVVAASMTLFVKRHTEHQTAVAVQPTPLEDKSRDSGRTLRKRAALLAQVGRFEFDVAKLAGIEGTPLVYWWDDDFLEEYVKAPKLGDVAQGRFGLTTGDNPRFVRFVHELSMNTAIFGRRLSSWAPFVLGGKGRKWFEPLRELCRWEGNGLEVKEKCVTQYGTVSKQIRNEDAYFVIGIAFAMIGSSFSGRIHRYPSVIGNMGSSVFPEPRECASILALMNSAKADFTLSSLNPGVHFEVGDVNRLAVFDMDNADALFVSLARAFSRHESHREPSVEFKQPGPSPWRYAQEWAQRAVDRPKGAPLPPYGKVSSEAEGRGGPSTAADPVRGAGAQPVVGGRGRDSLPATRGSFEKDPQELHEELDQPDPVSFVSFAIGVALGRFGENGEGILDLSLTPSDDKPNNQAPTRSRGDGGGLSTAADPAGGAGAQPVGGEQEPAAAEMNRSTSGDGGGHSPLKSAQAKALSGSTGSSWAGAKNTKSRQSAPKSRNDAERAHPAMIEQTETSKVSDLLDAANDARNEGAPDGLEVPNIAPSPLPPGQHILPHGILFVSAAQHVADSTAHPAFARIQAAWSEHGAAITNGKKTSLQEWLRADFFAYHKSLYENRPIYFPLSSAGKSFVAFVSIHRWAGNTLQALLASYLLPAREKLQGEINDLNQARLSSDKKAQAAAEKQYTKSQKLLEELSLFITDVTQIAEKGAPPTDKLGSSKGACPPREVDAPFQMDLDDGVMINSAALWPLLLPQWKDPKKWWKELCTADGRKDYDWAHLAARYFPTRVDGKCKTDPSLGVAHGCFWKYHPAKAYAWELRLQDEIGPDFTIDEAFPTASTAGNPHVTAGSSVTAHSSGPPNPRAASDKYRTEFLRDHPDQAAEIQAKEEQRRERKRNKSSKTEEADVEPGSFELRAE